MATALTSNEVLKKLNLSRSTFYYLLKNNIVSIPTTESGRYVWDDSVIAEITKALSDKTVEITEDISPKPKTTRINNRRYLGNKYKLLDFIRNTIAIECKGINTVFSVIIVKQKCRNQILHFCLLSLESATLIKFLFFIPYGNCAFPRGFLL